MKPVKVKTVQVKAGQTKLASAGPSQPVAPPITSAIPARPEVAETSSAVCGERCRRQDRSRQGRPPGSNAAAASRPWHRSRPARRVARLQPHPGARAGVSARPDDGLCRSGAPRPAAAVQQNEAVKPAAPAVVRTGWIVQVGALESESEAKQRIDLARNKASAPAQQGRSVHRNDRVQGQAHAVPRPLRRPRPRFRPKRSAERSSAPTSPA